MSAVGGSSPSADADRLTTVGVICWNHESYVLECLQSIRTSLGAGTRDVVVVDNGSIDRSANLIASFIDEFKLDWKFIRNPINYGIPRACNQVLDAATTPFTSMISADDFVDEQRYLLQENALAEAAEVVVMAGGVAVRVDELGALSSPEVHILAPSCDGVTCAKDLYMTSVTEKYESPSLKIQYRGTPLVLTQMWRTQTIRDLGGYDERFPFEDTPLELKALSDPDTRFLHVPGSLMFYREHRDSVTRSMLWASAWQRNLEVHLSEYEYDPGLESRLRIRLSSVSRQAAYESGIRLLLRREYGARMRLLGHGLKSGSPVRQRLNSLALALLPTFVSGVHRRYQLGPWDTLGNEVENN